MNADKRRFKKDQSVAQPFRAVPKNLHRLESLGHKDCLTYLRESAVIGG